MQDKKIHFYKDLHSLYTITIEFLCYKSLENPLVKPNKQTNQNKAKNNNNNKKNLNIVITKIMI